MEFLRPWISVSQCPVAADPFEEMAISMGFMGEYWVNDDLGIHDLRNYHFYVSNMMINQYEPV